MDIRKAQPLPWIERTFGVLKRKQIDFPPWIFVVAIGKWRQNSR